MKDIISFLSTTNVNIVNSWRAAHCPGCRAGERGLNWIFFTNLYFHSWWDFLLDVFHLFVYFHLVREVGPVLVTWLWRGCPRAAPQNLGRVAWLLFSKQTKHKIDSQFALPRLDWRWGRSWRSPRTSGLTSREVVSPTRAGRRACLRENLRKLFLPPHEYLTYNCQGFLTTCLV